MKNKELNNILDQVTAGIRAEQVDDATVSDATRECGRGYRVRRMRTGCARTARRMRRSRYGRCRRGRFGRSD